jgi:hypothetical protein
MDLLFSDALSRGAWGERTHASQAIEPLRRYRDDIKTKYSEADLAQELPVTERSEVLRDPSDPRADLGCVNPLVSDHNRRLRCVLSLSPTPHERRSGSASVGALHCPNADAAHTETFCGSLLLDVKR